MSAVQLHRLCRRAKRAGRVVVMTYGRDGDTQWLIVDDPREPYTGRAT